MKLSMALLSLALTLPSLACPGMDQADHIERKGFKVDMPLDKDANGVVHQHSAEAQPSVSLESDKTPRQKPSQANKKGRLHKS